MFLFKKIVSRFFFPLPLCLEILIVGLILLWFSKKQRLGKIMVTSGTILLLMLSYTYTSDHLLLGLEYTYPSIGEEPEGASPAHDPRKPVKWIVVLGGGQNSDPALPVTSQVGSTSLTRLVEGLRLYMKNPGSKLILSGGGVYGPSSEAEAMFRVARALRVPREDLILESESRDTEEQARLIEPLVGKEELLLVTSASHMPRAMAVFREQGLHCMAAPTNHQIKRYEGIVPDSFFPQPKGLEKATTAFYEYLGLAWLKIRGKI